MLVISIAASKGGAGKSTCAWLLAGALRELGHSVAIGDADEQQSLLPLAGALPVFDARAALESADPLAAVAQEAARAAGAPVELLLLDLPGRGPSIARERTTRAAIAGASLLLIPCQPSAVDLRALGPLLALLEEARAAGLAGTVRTVGNRLKVGTLAAQELRPALAMRNLESLEAALHDRAAYQRALLVGALPSALGDPRARAEVLALAEEIAGLLEIASSGNLSI